MEQISSVAQMPSSKLGDRESSFEDLVDIRKQQRPPLPPPHILASLVPDSPAFLDLLKVEQKLDWTLLRKKAEINDAMGKPIRVSRRARLS
jgi:SWI/SNF-related matrix-associated actin-dependent regulator of chromatin subfamily D